MWKSQVDQQRKAERERLRAEREHTELELVTPELDNFGLQTEDDQVERQIVIKIMPDGTLYTAEHEMSLQMEGLEKPRRKRGRPPKVQAEVELKDLTKEMKHEAGSQGEDEKQEEELEEVDGDGRRRRKRKVPKRFMEAVQGKELERIFKEEGVIDEEEDDNEPDNDYDDPEERLNLPTPDGHEEIIGHLETQEGKDLGELVIVNRGRGRGRPRLRKRKTKFTCHLCGRGFLQRSRYIMHKSFHKGVKYECLECKKQFTNRDNFGLHQKTSGHTGEGIIENQVDNEVRSQGSSIAEEGANIVTGVSREVQDTVGEVLPIDEGAPLEDDGQVTECEQCQKQFPSRQSYEVHAKMVHQEEKPYTCNLCNKTFAYHTSLKGHMLAHEANKSDKGFPCDICGKVLNHPSSVVYHKEAEHNNGRRFVCNKCGKSFKHKQLLQRHQLVHSDDRPYVCKSCGATFKTKANLINHQSIHTGEKKYFCEICGQQFAHKTSLTLHYRWHTGHKPYTCEVCSKSFSQNGNLQEHMRIHTGEKPYCCDYCGRKFTTSSQFKLHVKRHTGERPWKCEFCAKCFLHKDTWKCHVRRHKGERPFQCAHCNRGFTEQWALKKHLRLHTGEKPYSCNICGKAFADCSNLTKHKKVHRENKVVGVGELSENSAMGEVWQILPGSHEGDENSLGDQVNQVLPTDEASGDGLQQIIYVSYQDPDDPNQSRTLHFVDVGMMENKEVATAPGSQSLPSLEAEEGDEVTEHVTQDEENPEPDERINMDLAESDLQLQITDEEGNPIPLSIQDARQLLSEGQFVSQLEDGQTIRVHSGVLTQELAQQLEVDDQGSVGTEQTDGVAVDATGNAVSLTPSHTHADAEDIVKALEDEDTDATAVAAVNHQLETEEQTEMMDGEQTIEFTTQDGQKVRLVTSYHVDPMQLASEYLTIV
ncbi:zinc finger protein 62 homolog isoform X2 [Athalia rosae]|nr:zinc finger protein 62 homolog isoform X2 [Athalia rosae]